ncbi:hypothetical protein [Methylobacterium sp. WL6]|uniref:hypothetical protein n=1 Tax=Methylobacterium sp. WL6 TaxID=2603901 RepID=UPI0011C70DDD|nr:hypothetical protein [Methylobacterium sp. WL6]TXN70157.1 hypothetical protein FV230_10935 [Methylobacterium sp. WL6]
MVDEKLTRASESKQSIREKIAAMLCSLILAYYCGSWAMSQFEDAAVLRDGQVVDARVMSTRTGQGVIRATIEYRGMAEGREVACVAEVSLGKLRSSPTIGEQISLSVRPGPCARPVSRTALQLPWVFVGLALLMLAVAVASAISLVRRAIPSGQQR